MTGHHNTQNVHEILARVKAKIAARDGISNDNDTGRASLKDMRDSHESEPKQSDLAKKIAALGAHPLSIRSRREELKGCAPDGDSTSSKVIPMDLEAGEKTPHAVAQSLPATASEEPMATLHSAISEAKQDLRPDDDTPAPAADDDDYDPATATNNFYEIKADLFDNSIKGKKNVTDHRAKIFIRNKPTTPADRASIFMLDFYNRARGINRRIDDMEMQEDAWYDDLKAKHIEIKGMKVMWQIEPKIAVLKELDPEDKTRSDAIAYAGAILYQFQNQPPTILFYYGGTVYEITLDFEFKRTPGSTIYKKGILRDASRQTDDVELLKTKKAVKFKRASDFD